MKYKKDFISRVLTVVRDPRVKNDIENGKLDLGDYLKDNAFKGIDSKIILECLNLNNLEHLYQLAIEQEKMKALYQEWFEYYVMKSGERLKQEEINAEINQHEMSILASASKIPGLMEVDRTNDLAIASQLFSKEKNMTLGRKKKNKY